MATIQEVAKHAGVSRSTVSRVMNGYKHVTPEIREKVLKSISQLNYRPNMLARNLRKQFSNSVGVVVRQQKTPFSSELGYAIENVLFEQGYHVLLCSTDGNFDRESNYVDMLIEHQVSGVILRPSVPSEPSAESVEKLLEHNIHVVIVDIEIPNAGVSQILSQNFKGGYDGGQYLIQQGHRDIAVIGSELDQDTSLNYPGSLRINGILQAFREFPTPLEPSLWFSNEVSHFERGYITTKKILETQHNVTAIFGITDMIAVGAMHAAHEHGLKIPEDLSVMGYDDTPTSSYLIPRLTTVAQPIHAMGEAAATTLLQHMTETDTPIRTVILENRLQIRESTSTVRK